METHCHPFLRAKTQFNLFAVIVVTAHRICSQATQIQLLFIYFIAVIF